jgi:hypothetical protein
MTHHTGAFRPVLINLNDDKTVLLDLPTPDAFVDKYLA